MNEESGVKAATDPVGLTAPTPPHHLSVESSPSSNVQDAIPGKRSHPADNAAGIAVDPSTANGETSSGGGNEVRRKSTRARKDKPALVTRPVAAVRSKPGRARRRPSPDFRCDLCASPFVVDPRRRGGGGHAPKQRPTPRHRIDPVTKTRLNLCNACGLSNRGGTKPRKNRGSGGGACSISSSSSEEDKQKYLSEANRFAVGLVSEFNDSDAERLFCPQFKKQACRCIQRYIDAEGDAEESRKRTLLLLQLIKEAKRLNSQKSYNVNEVQRRGSSSTAAARTSAGGGGGGGSARPIRPHPPPIGLGNGHKKSKMFEEFVLENREYLRGALKLCERGAQKILVYSNNFLHKRLKTAPPEERAARVRRQKGKAALGLLPTVEQMQRLRCCGAHCVALAATHARLLLSWRERVAGGQAEARRVLAEMLTPSGGARSNCYKFINMVTGCSNSTICRVSEQMKNTGGDREPPEHGLKKWWEQNSRPRSEQAVAATQDVEDAAAANIGPPLKTGSTGGEQQQQQQQQMANDKPSHQATVNFKVPAASLDNLTQLQMKHKQVINLQSQLAKQQMALQQEQLMIEQQLQQQCGILQVPSHMPTAKRLFSSVILDVPTCLQTSRPPLGYALAPSDPMNNGDSVSSSNLNITILPQHESDLDGRPDCLSGVSFVGGGGGGTLSNFVLIQSPSGSIIDTIPLVLDTDYQSACSSGHSYTLIPEAVSTSGAELLQTLNHPPEATAEGSSANGGRTYLRTALPLPQQTQTQQTSHENLTSRPSILDLTTIGSSLKPK